MIEKKFINLKKQEFEIKEYLKKNFDYVSSVKVERTPLGEKIIIKSCKPHLIFGSRGENIDKIIEILKKQFGLDNPQIEVQPIDNMFLDAASVAEYIKKSLEKFGPLSFKVVAYRALDKIKEAGAIGAEIRLTGKLPSERARSWLFSFGNLIKSGAYREQIVDYAKTEALTIPGYVGIKVRIIKPFSILPDKIEIKEKTE
ncbi:MAG: 30S ribosomal protein S3 [Candidatus Pacearchaeota archaeon]